MQPGFNNVEVYTGDVSERNNFFNINLGDHDLYSDFRGLREPPSGPHRRATSGEKRKVRGRNILPGSPSPTSVLGGASTSRGTDDHEWIKNDFSVPSSGTTPSTTTGQGPSTDYAPRLLTRQSTGFYRHFGWGKSNLELFIPGTSAPFRGRHGPREGRGSGDNPSGSGNPTGRPTAAAVRCREPGWGRAWAPSLGQPAPGSMLQPAAPHQRPGRSMASALPKLAQAGRTDHYWRRGGCVERLIRQRRVPIQQFLRPCPTDRWGRLCLAGAGRPVITSLMAKTSPPNGFRPHHRHGTAQPW